MERGLQQFLTVAELGSISAASKQLNVTQPTITVNIRNLEEKYKVPLFERNPRGMVLTPFGSILLEKTRVMHRLEEQALREIEHRRKGINHIISVGCGHAWWPLFVREAVENVTQKKDKAPVYVENGSNLNCMWKLLSGEVLASVGHRVPDLAPGIGAEFKGFFRVKDMCYVAKGHPLLGRKCTMEDLIDMYVVNSVPLGKEFSKILTVSGVKNIPEEKFPENPKYWSNSLVTCIDMVKRTGGFTVFPLDMADSLDELGLQPLDLDDGFDMEEVGVYVLTERRNEPEVKYLVRSISASAERYKATRKDQYPSK